MDTAKKEIPAEKEILTCDSCYWSRQCSKEFAPSYCRFFINHKPYENCPSSSECALTDEECDNDILKAFD